MWKIFNELKMNVYYVFCPMQIQSPNETNGQNCAFQWL